MSALDMSEALVEELLQLERGVILYDSYLNRNIFVIAPVICILADNARASELTNHLGATANKFCRKCMVRQKVKCYTVHVFYLHLVKPY